MSGRSKRLSVATRLAVEAEQRARSLRADANRQLQALDREREGVLDRAGTLAERDLPHGLRGHLASVGARHLVALSGQKTELVGEAQSRQHEHDAARARLRSLQRVVERLEDAERLQRQRQEEADLRDLAAARTIRRNQ